MCLTENMKWKENVIYFFVFLHVPFSPVSPDPKSSFSSFPPTHHVFAPFISLWPLIAHSPLSPHVAEVNTPAWPDPSSARLSSLSHPPPLSLPPLSLLFEVLSPSLSYLPPCSIHSLLLYFAALPSFDLVHRTLLCGFIWMGGLVLININGPPAVE